MPAEPLSDEELAIRRRSHENQDRSSSRELQYRHAVDARLWATLDARDAEIERLDERWRRRIIVAAESRTLMHRRAVQAEADRDRSKAALAEIERRSQNETVRHIAPAFAHDVEILAHRALTEGEPT